MWPNVDLENRELCNFPFDLRYANITEWKKPNIIIREIIMIFAEYHNITFSHSDIVCAIDYDTDFGYHTILFSKVPQSDFKVKGGMQWFNIYSSNLSPKYNQLRTHAINDGPRKSIDVQVLTDIYKNTVKNFNESDLQEEQIPEDFLKNLLPN